MKIFNRILSLAIAASVGSYLVATPAFADGYFYIVAQAPAAGANALGTILQVSPSFPTEAACDTVEGMLVNPEVTICGPHCPNPNFPKPGQKFVIGCQLGDPSTFQNNE
jgi:hypothetical protein